MLAILPTAAWAFAAALVLASCSAPPLFFEIALWAPISMLCIVVLRGSGRDDPSVLGLMIGSLAIGVFITLLYTVL